jgi:hypothetical protein
MTEFSGDPNATLIIDRNGRRTRVYLRKDAGRPGQQERRKRALFRERWCRGCREWLPAGAVARQGVCRTCANAEWRRRYAVSPTAIRLRVHARKRAVDALPAYAAELLLEQFGGRCAYCPDLATTWDHLVPVARGGRTEPGNIVPACCSCNSSKRSTPLLSWLEQTRRTPNPALWDVLALDPAGVG